MSLSLCKSPDKKESFLFLFLFWNTSIYFVYFLSLKYKRTIVLSNKVTSLLNHLFHQPKCRQMFGLYSIFHFSVPRSLFSPDMEIEDELRPQTYFPRSLWRFIISKQLKTGWQKAWSWFPFAGNPVRFSETFKFNLKKELGYVSNVNL